MRCLAVLYLLLLALVPRTGAQLIVAGGPVAPDGSTEVQIDFPNHQKLENCGGRDGAGLCVFTSINHSARWQNERRLERFQEQMRAERGGGWPGKVDAMISKYADGTQYLQYVGRDLAVLKAVLRSGRSPAVTYAGDDKVFYRHRVYHMVNLLHLDEKWCAILDNNFVGERQILWMTPAQFAERYNWPADGWMVALLAPPPPPVPTLTEGQARYVHWEPSGPIQPDPAAPEHYEWRTAAAHPRHRYLYLGAQLLGSWSEREETWHPRVAEGWGPAIEQAPVGRPECMRAPVANYGVRRDQWPSGEMYVINGHSCTRRTALAALTADRELPKDTDKLRLTVIGDEKFRHRVLEDLDRAPPLAPWKERLLVQDYPAEHWSVAGLGFPARGIVVQAPPSADGRGRVLHQQTSYDGPEPFAGALRLVDKGYDKEKAPDLTKTAAGAWSVPWVELILLLVVVALVVIILGVSKHVKR